MTTTPLRLFSGGGETLIGVLVRLQEIRWYGKRSWVRGVERAEGAEAAKGVEAAGGAGAEDADV